MGVHTSNTKALSYTEWGKISFTFVNFVLHNIEYSSDRMNSNGGSTLK